MNERSIEITQSHIDLLLPVIEKATQYEEIINHKRKLGITGEIGEVKACFRYGLKFVLDSQSPGMMQLMLKVCVYKSKPVEVNWVKNLQIPQD